MTQPEHGVAAALWSSDRGWRGVWIVGPPGAGKSDLALRLIGRGWRLVADDYAHLFASAGRVYACAPETIRGRIEARGVGVGAARAQGLARIDLVVALTDGAVERLPDPDQAVLAGVSVARITLNPFEASAVEKVAAALQAL